MLEKALSVLIDWVRFCYLYTLQLYIEGIHKGRLHKIMKN